MGPSIGQFKLFACLAIFVSSTAAYIPLVPDKDESPAAAVTTAPADDIKPFQLTGKKDKGDDAEPSEAADKATAGLNKLDDASATQPAENAKPEEAQLEVFVPSVVALAHAFEDSKTSDLVEAVRNIIPPPDEIAGEETLDVAALANLSEHLLSWPDTSLTFTTFSQDRDGRPRWALGVNWPLPDFVSRVQTLLDDEAAKSIFENVRLVQDGDAWRLELPDMVLAYLRPTDGGAMLTATENLTPPTEVYGVAEIADKKGRYKDSRLFCRLNLDAGDEESKNPMFSALLGVSSIDYELRLLKNGSWREMFVVKWNAMVGLAAKAIFQKTKNPFECPDDAFINAVFNLGAISESAPDGITGLPAGTIGTRTTGDMAFSLMPGTGVIPFPDTFFQFRTGPRHLLVHKIRDAVNADTAKRREDDRPAAWYEERIDGDIVFWKDPSADGGYGLAPATFRTVVFFHPPLSEDERNHDPDNNEENKNGDSDEKSEGDESKDDTPRMVVIANTTNWADDAVRNFREQIAHASKMPSTKKMDWQARINWANAYDLAYPYIAIGTGFADGAGMPPEPRDVNNLLSDSRLDVKISVGGFLARHIGPVPVGGIYVPALAGLTLSSSADPRSEIAREQTACRRLRVLYHHCKLFKKDYGRWPATVAELDGYVDFASHPQLLQLRDKKVGLMQSFASAFAIDDKNESKTNSTDDAEEEINDDLYVIDWSEDDAGWRLKLRAGEFDAYDTIYIDAEGRIHRVPKSETKTARGRDDQDTDSESPKL